MKPLQVAEMVLVELKQHDRQVMEHYVANGAQGHHKGQLANDIDTVMSIERSDYQLTLTHSPLHNRILNIFLSSLFIAKN